MVFLLASTASGFSGGALGKAGAPPTIVLSRSGGRLSFDYLGSTTVIMDEYLRGCTRALILPVQGLTRVNVSTQGPYLTVLSQQGRTMP